MCYYSLSLRRGQFRSAKQGEDLVVSHFDGHGIVRAESDSMIACVAGGTMVQIPEFRLTKAAEQNFCLSYPWMCEAIGKPVELSAPPGLEPFAPEQGAPTPVARDPESPSLASLPLRLETETRPAEPPPRKPTEATRTASPVSQLSPPSSRPTTAIAMGAVILLAFGTWWFGFRQPSRPVPPSTPRVETPAPREQAPPPANAAAGPAPIPAPPETPAPTEKPAIAAPPVKRVAPETTARGDVSVAEAKLCRSLTTSNWTCTPATSPSAPGAFFFYTKVKSARDTTVQHRWLMDGRLVRSIDLRIKANPGAGYRTYSRNTVSGGRRSDWTIELRDAGGALLHEERFTVQ